ncbi:hypothetical protein [uncultured Mailhella sp.]|uniref:hypothetical protein n=1 Tax=uncultured Mailhella sp. TaxID=1981031 RepID=UPI00263165CD|nr:hypothetical protein [uncultured Mailhella sp.]
MELTLCFCLNTNFAHAETPMSDRIAVQAGVKTEIAKDLSQLDEPLETLSGRTCLDGSPADGFQGDIAELWSNLECPYCGIQEPFQAQRDNPAPCIVVRHISSDNCGQAGQGTVLRTTGLNVNEEISSDYRDANSATAEQEDRVVLRDLQEQIEGRGALCLFRPDCPGRHVLRHSLTQKGATESAAVAATGSRSDA